MTQCKAPRKAGTRMDDKTILVEFKSDAERHEDLRRRTRLRDYCRLLNLTYTEMADLLTRLHGERVSLPSLHSWVANHGTRKMRRCPAWPLRLLDAHHDRLLGSRNQGCLNDYFREFGWSPSSALPELRWAAEREGDPDLEALLNTATEDVLLLWLGDAHAPAAPAGTPAVCPTDVLTLLTRHRKELSQRAKARVDLYRRTTLREYKHALGWTNKRAIAELGRLRGQSVSMSAWRGWIADADNKYAHGCPQWPLDLIRDNFELLQARSLS